MHNWISIEKNDALLRLLFLDLALKLVIAPWATGDFATSWGSLLNYATDGILFGIVFMQFRRFPRSYLPIFYLFIFTGITYALSTFFFTDKTIPSSLINHLRLYLPFLLVPATISLVSQSRLDVNRPIYAICWLILILIMLSMVLLPPSYNRLEVWLPSWFGNLHSTGYVALMTGFMLHTLVVYKRISPWLALPIIFVLFLLIAFGWGVRTTSIGFVIYFFGLISSRFLFKNRPLVAVFFPLAIALPVSVLPALDLTGDINQLSSGRIRMYIAKYEQLMANDFSQWFIGNGYFSDLIITDGWWWEEKGAHSDLITFMVEGGLFYFFGFLLVARTFFKNHDSLPERLILIAIFSTSIFSNGVVVRPIAAYLLSLIYALHFSNRQRLAKKHAQ